MVRKFSKGNSKDVDINILSHSGYFKNKDVIKERARLKRMSVRELSLFTKKYKKKHIGEYNKTINFWKKRGRII